MSKIETLRSYAQEQSASQLQVVQAIRDLQRLTEELPTAVATEINQALQPLAVLSSLDDLLAQQRRSVEIISLAMTEAAEAAIQPLGEAAATSQRAAKTMRQQAQALADAASKHGQAAANLAAAAKTAQAQARKALAAEAESRKKEWVRLASVTMVAGLISAGVMLAGMHVFGSPAPPAVHAQQMGPPLSATAAPSGRPGR